MDELTKQLSERYDHLIEVIDIKGDMPTLTIKRDGIQEVARFLKYDADPAFEFLTDLTAVHNNPSFTVVYHLYSIRGNRRIRLKVEGEEIPSLTSIWRVADWYEREVFDMFGIRFPGHPNLKRILMPEWWKGHPLRKDHPAKATEMEDFGYEEALKYEEMLRVEETSTEGETEILTINMGPQHPGTHGLLRLVLRLDGEVIEDVVPDIGYLHRGVEKIAEQRTYHQFIIYTDRLDYLSGALNDLAYVTAIERLLCLDVPKRAQYIRVILSELFRICNHLVWLGTFAHDLGAITPVFFTFRDREDAFEIVEMLSGGRMHPSFFRIGGVAKDIPDGFADRVRDFVRTFPERIKDYEDLLTGNPVFLKRTEGIGVIKKEDAIDLGLTGPNLRASGLEFDLRKRLPYSSYEDFEFDIPVQSNGDCYARYLVRMEEMRQSIRIIEQAIDRLPEGPCISEVHSFSIPQKEEVGDIHGLIRHFIHVSRGFPAPPGEVYHSVESSKGEMGFYIVSREGEYPYRLRIRAPSFPHVQAIPFMVKGLTVADLVAILGSIDYVLADVDR